MAALEDIVILPNAEAMVSEFLRTHAAMAALVSARVYTELPKDCQFPCVRVNLYDDVKVTTRPLWLATSSIQVEAFGGTKAQAYQIAATAQALLDARFEGVHTGGTVTGTIIGGLRDQPDVSSSPARPRWLFTAYVSAHP